MWDNCDHDSGGKYFCYTNLYPAGTLLCGGHTGYITGDFAEWHHGYLEPGNHQHSKCGFNGVHFYSQRGTVWDNNDHDRCGKSQCNADLYPAGTLLCGSHPGSFIPDIDQWHHGNLESFNRQHSFGGNDGIHLYANGRAMCHNHHDDHCGESQCHTDLYPTGALLCGRHPGYFTGHFAERHIWNMEPVYGQHGLCGIDGLHFYPVGRAMCHHHHHDGSGKCHCHAHLYPVRALLCGGHSGDFAHHFAERHHRNMESFDDQHDFSGFHGLHLYPIGRSMRYDHHHDRSG